MLKWIEATGRTEDAAVQNALAELGLDRATPASVILFSTLLIRVRFNWLILLSPNILSDSGFP